MSGSRPRYEQCRGSNRGQSRDNRHNARTSAVAAAQLVLLLLSRVMVALSLGAQQPLLFTGDAMQPQLSELATMQARAPSTEPPADALQQCATVFVDTSSHLETQRWFWDPNWHRCPAHCPSLLHGSGAAAAVLGSFPYDGNSSICLAAVHCGAIDDELGGVVLAAPFMPADWSNSSTQTIYPHASYSASLSNGVQSLEVPAERRRVPSRQPDMSWTVSSRGPVITRRIAPFSPRAGHVVIPLQTGGCLLVGGHNASDGMNDVWMYSSWQWGTWRRLPDAPFTPRFDMIAYSEEAFSASAAPVIYFIGGQTGAACGLQELGLCSNEVWAAWLNTNETQEFDQFELRWLSTSAPYALLPFAARCDAACGVRPSFREPDWEGVPVLAIIGGQLSYNDSSCSTPPLYSSEVYYSTMNVSSDGSSWRKGQDAPFSPRRGQLSDRFFTFQGFITRPLLGGIRYLNVSFDAARNRSRLTSAIMHADVWTCWLQADYVRFDECMFGWPQGPGEPPLPVGSLPFAVAGRGGFSASEGTQLGGVVSAASARRWQSTPPKFSDTANQRSPFNVTVMLRQLTSPLDNSSWPTPQQQDDERFNLSWYDIVDEAELNDPHGAFALGSDWTLSVGWNSPAGSDPRLYMTTVYQQTAIMTESADDPNPYTYHAMSAGNSTRGLFNFSLRRLEHYNHLANDRTAISVVSGGRSGSLYFNDWMELHCTNVGPAPEFCPPVDDPSYSRVLGPVRAVEPPPYPVFGLGALVRAECANASYHWEPPSVDPQVDLFCSNNGVWMDLDHFTIRKCVLSSEHCTPPRRDDGLGNCEMPASFITSISIDFPGVRQVDAITLTALPLQVSLQLTVRGSFFMWPLTVVVGGHDCLLPRLLLSNASYSLCHNGSRTYCDYADAFTCDLVGVYGAELPVRVWSGPQFENVDVSDELRGRLATVSTTHPIILSLHSTACVASPESEYQLLQCAVTTDFDVDVWLDADSVLVEQTVLLLDWRLLNCSIAGVRSPGCPFGLDACVHARCHVYPQFGERLLRAASDVGAALSEQLSSLSFATCAAGSRNDYEAALRGNASSLCILCPPGFSTVNGSNQAACTACLPGSFSDVEGSALCKRCPMGTSTAELNSTSCAACSLNSWQQFAGQDRCDDCDLGTYIHYDTTNASSARTAATCLQCPFRARCSTNGTVEAEDGAYLLLDQSTGTVQSVPCSPTACVGAASSDRQATAADLLQNSGLPVLNWCGVNRLPALSAADEHNVLCAACLPQHSAVNGVCVPCAGAGWGWLTLALLLLALLVYALHRAPHDFSGSGVLSIAAYFLQLSLVFLASQWMPPMLSVVNLSLLASHQPYGAQLGAVSAHDSSSLRSCTLPLDDYGRMAVQLLSPPVAVAMLAVVYGAQWLARALLSRHDGPTARRLYEAVFGFGEARSAAQAAAAVPLMKDAEAEAVVVSPRPFLYQRTLVRMALLSYSSVALTTLSFFRLQEVGAFGYRVADYPQMAPSDAAYRAMMPPLLLLLLTVVCGLPLAVTALLLHHHRMGGLKLRGDAASSAENPTARRRDALVQQLVCMFRSQVWWWSVVVLLRRLLVAAVLVLVRSSAVWNWLTLVNYLIMAAHMRVWPYQRSIDNAAEMICLLSLSLQTTLLSVWPPPIDSQALLAALLCCLALPLLPLLVSPLLYRRIQQQEAERSGLPHRWDDSHL